jgi:hypothetical protein
MTEVNKVKQGFAPAFPSSEFRLPLQFGTQSFPILPFMSGVVRWWRRRWPC